MVQLNRAVLLQDVWGVEAGGGGGGVCGGECVIMLAPPLTDVSLCFTHNTSRRLGSKFSHPRRAPAPSERTWWWITKPQGCTSIIHYNCYKHRSPESSCGGIGAESWSRRQWKLQDSGHELGSDLCHSFRPPEPEGEGATDRRTLALRPLRSRAETQMLLCYSGKRIPQKTLYTEAEMEEEEEVEQAGRSDYSSDKDVGRHSRHSGTKNNTKYFKAAIINSFISIKWL